VNASRGGERRGSVFVGAGRCSIARRSWRVFAAAKKSRFVAAFLGLT